MLGKILGGRYQIDRHLGGGGFGQTYLAEDLHLPGKPQCVVKQLKPRMTSPEALQAARRLFDAEAEALYALGSHEQIPRLFAHFEEHQEFYLVQEFIAGDVLSQELKTHKSFSEAEVIHLLQDVLAVLEFVHQQQVVHRDIKPSNLIRRQDDRRIVLIDFGAVKQIGIQASDAHEASVTIAVGSSGYMPNEQLAGKPRFSSDIYAVGMLALQCLTGVYPKKLKEDPKTSEIIWRDQIQVSSELATILDTMVRYDFRQRYPSATEALEALSSLTSTTSVAALLSEQTFVSLDGHIAWSERGDELFQLQRYREAVVAYDRVIQAKSHDYITWFKRGIALENLNNYEEAMASYEQVVQIQPDDYLAWYKRGAACEALQQYLEALQSYDRVVALQPENYWVWNDRGQVLENLQQDDDAIASYDRAVQLKPDFQIAMENRKRLLSQLKRVDTLYHLQHYDEAVASCDRAIQQNPDDSLAWFMRGMASENLQHYEEAVTAYSRVVEIQPDDQVAWFKLGTVQEKLQRYDDAVASYYKVVQIQPDNYWAWNDRGRLLEKLDQYETAIASYDRAVQLKPDFESAVEGRRRLLRQQQHEITASSEEDDATVVSAGSQRLSTSKAQELRSVIEGYERLLAVPHSVLPQQEAQQEETVVSRPRTPQETMTHSVLTEETIVSFPKANDRDSDDRDAVANPANAEEADNQSYANWVQKGRELEQQQRYTEAIVAYDQASQIRADDYTLWCRRGSVLYTLERYEEAVVSYSRSLELISDNSDVWCYLGGSLARLKRYTEALACFDRATQLEPERHTFWYYRGRMLCSLKQYDNAIKSFERAIEIKPDFQPARGDLQQVQRRLKALQIKSLTAQP